MCALCRYNLTSYSFFQTNVLAKFVDVIGIFFYTYSPYIMCHSTEYKLSALQVEISEENKLNATTQQFITAKTPGCVLKQGSKTHSSRRQRNLQPQNEAALMSCRMRSFEHRKRAGGLAVTMCKKYVRKLSIFVCMEIQQTFLFSFFPAETL